MPKVGVVCCLAAGKFPGVSCSFNIILSKGTFEGRERRFVPNYFLYGVPNSVVEFLCLKKGIVFLIRSCHWKTPLFRISDALINVVAEIIGLQGGVSLIPFGEARVVSR